MKVYKVNKAEMIKAIILSLILIGTLVAGCVVHKDFLLVYFGMTIVLLFRFFGLFPEKPAIESIEIEEEENEIE